MSDPRSALVLGATGTVGSALCEALLQEGWAVHGAARFSQPGSAAALREKGTEAHVFDAQREDPAALPDVDVVFLEIWDPRHIAGEHLQDCWSLNFDAVGRVVRRYAGTADIINGSTGSLYGPRADRPSHEDDPPRPAPGRADTEYALARLAQERLIDFLCAEAGSRCFHLRYYRSNTERGGALRAIAESVLAGRSLGDRPDERIQVIALADFVRCTVRAVDHLGPKPQRVNVVHPRIWTLRGLAERLREEMGAGEVVFDAEAGGAEASIWGDPVRMRAYFGEPQEGLDPLIERVCRAVLVERGG
jgi:nucleoside-diphosphate-sugar epimerase